jgi:hypothetical protein
MKHRKPKATLRTDAEGPALTHINYSSVNEIESYEGTLSKKIEEVLGDDRSGRKFLYIVITFSVVMRALVGLSYYSGENMPPKYGDFECHRHWMEFTHHAPVHTWYTDGPLMNYTYWPMDYPPLCAYTHWFWSHIINLVEPNAIKL